MCPVPFFLQGHTMVLGLLLNVATGLSRPKADVSGSICLSPGNPRAASKEQEAGLPDGTSAQDGLKSTSASQAV